MVPQQRSPAPGMFITRRSGSTIQTWLAHIGDLQACRTREHGGCCATTVQGHSAFRYETLCFKAGTTYH